MAGAKAWGVNPEQEVTMTPKELFLEAMRRTDTSDVEGFVAMQAEDCTWVVPGAELHGLDAIREWLAPWGAFPGYRHELTTVLEHGDTVVAEGVWRGVHSRPLPTPQGDVAPTGRELSFRFAIALEIDPRAGRSRHVRVYFDQLEFLAGLGLAPDMAAA